ncbi:uncharacterized protein LY89DRAFT_275618 [Mollisia scopiformis]|uniref:Uncharacterized protein n=1 Tax=Mollisia scopiformis TaxID=149040 RepID=A0A132BBB7_MOLSC|nr:uncharacterized protein LY89DRAFT_275618 [Mollisia scopiformis]KUJ09686.1 hypothetical protein LY89DRAFT_275618 [Mollisia scopiformis]
MKYLGSAPSCSIGLGKSIHKRRLLQDDKTSLECTDAHRHQILLLGGITLALVLPVPANAAEAVISCEEAFETPNDHGLELHPSTRNETNAVGLNKRKQSCRPCEPGPRISAAFAGKWRSWTVSREQE